MSNEDELDEVQLSDAERELETALRSLRPTPARINPMAATLAAGRRTAPGPLRYWQIAATAAAIAIAGGAWLALSPRGQMPDRVERHAPEITPELAAATKRPVPPATMLAYRRALARSPAELEALLDLQAMAESARNQFTSVGMQTVWNADLRSLPGEM